jgi:hypothetical protein
MYISRNSAIEVISACQKSETPGKKNRVGIATTKMIKPSISVGMDLEFMSNRSFNGTLRHLFIDASNRHIALNTNRHDSLRSRLIKPMRRILQPAGF